jgi:hypothetical protein
MKEIKTEIDDIDELIAEPRALKIRVARLEQQQLPEDRDRDTFKIGDRVRVKNRVRKPTNWPIDRHFADQLAYRQTLERAARTTCHSYKDYNRAHILHDRQRLTLLATPKEHHKDYTRPYSR